MCTKINYPVATYDTLRRMERVTNAGWLKVVQMSSHGCRYLHPNIKTSSSFVLERKKKKNYTTAKRIEY